MSTLGLKYQFYRSSNTSPYSVTPCLSDYCGLSAPAYVGHRLLVECQGKKLLKCELFAFPRNEFQKYKLAKYSPGVPSNGG